MNLFDLSAKIEVQMGNFERDLSTAQKRVIELEKQLEKLNKTSDKSSAAAKLHTDHTTNLGHAFKALTASVVVADGPLGGVASRMRAMSTETSELAAAIGPGGMIVAGLVATAGAGLLAADALFKLAESTAKYGDDIFKAHEKTALTVETLSALKVAGDAVGVELSTMTTGLIRFTNNLEMAASGNKKMIDVFKQLGVTAFQDNDKALSQFIAKFATLRTDQERTVAAGQAFGVRFGASLVEVFNRVGGNVDEFKEQLHSMGLLMTDEGAESAHEFEVALEMLGMRIAGIGRTVGQEMLPAFVQAFSVLDGVIDTDLENWRQWGRDLAEVIRGATAIIAGYAGAVRGFFQNGIPGAVVGYISGVQNAVQQMDTYGANAPARQAIEAASRTAGGPRFHIPSESGEREKKAPRDPGLELLKQLTNEYNRVATSTEMARVQLQLLDAQYAKDSPQLKAQILAMAHKIDIQKEQDEFDKQAKKAAEDLARVTKDVNDALDEQNTAISDLMTGFPQWTRDALNFIAAKKNEGYVWDVVTAKIYLNNEAMKEQLRVQAEGATRLRRVFETSTGSETRPRIVDADGSIAQAKLDAFNQKMRSLASGITNVIDNALHDGFEKGMKAGLISFAQGILRMIESAALKALEDRLTELFSRALGGGSGKGGLVGAIFNLGAGLALGALGGGGKGGGMAGVGGKFASGGFMQPNTWNLVGERGPELIRSGNAGATVLPNGGGASHTFVININVPDIQSAGSRATQYQAAKAMKAHLERSVLMG